MTFLKMTDVKLAGKRVLIREDLNVPIKDGKITSDARILASLPTIQLALEEKAAVIVLSHLGRPTEGEYDEVFSLKPVADRLSELLKQPVPLVKDWLDGVSVNPGEVVLCENTRFNVGEKANQEELSKKMAKLCDIYVNDAFATAHRKEASTCGISKYVPIACAGPLLTSELEALGKVMEHPERPLVAIVGGAKVSTKLALLNSIAKFVDYLIVGGGIANTFIASAGYSVGKSLYEPDLIDKAEQLSGMSTKLGVQIPMPTDVVVSDKFAPDAGAYVQPISQVSEHEMILDIGPETSKDFAKIIKKAKTILWNGPMGAFEIDQFGKGTEAITKAIAESKAYSVAGGGDTIAAIEKYGVSDKISYISTGGGAFLSYLEGEKFPCVIALEDNYERSKK